MRQTREERRAADQAEYEASLQRAAEAAKEQREHPSAYWPMLGLTGLVIDLSKRRKAVPPRPDQ